MVRATFRIRFCCRSANHGKYPSCVAHPMTFDKWVLPLYYASMNTTVTLDRAGRVVIPKTLRDELHLEPGDTLELESEGERVTLRPVRSASPLRKERGVWVFRRGKQLFAAATDKALWDIRDCRDRENRGHGR